MEHSLFLAVPWMHGELIDLPPGCMTLLPGLPQGAAHGWQPAGLPWTGRAAAACLEELERAVRDGARGTPVQTLYAERLPEGLSASEVRALQEMTGERDGEPDDAAARHAQHVLLLAWLRERQALEMAELECQIARKRHVLSGILGGKNSFAERQPAVPEDALPPWRETFAAFLAFLPSMPEDTAFHVCSRGMAEEILQGDPSRCAASPLSMRAGELAALCGTAAQKSLDALGEAQRQRRISLYFPESLRRMQ